MSGDERETGVVALEARDGEPERLSAAAHGLLAAERAARVEQEERLKRLQADVRELSQLRDNFHTLYREERESREAAERMADERREAAEHQQVELAGLRSDVERLRRTASRLQETLAAQAALVAPVAGAGVADSSSARVAELERQLAEMVERNQALLAQRAAESLGIGAEVDSAAVLRVTELERKLAELTTHYDALRSEHTAMLSAPSDAAPSAAQSELVAEASAATLRVAELEHELVVLRAEHAELRGALDRAVTAQRGLEESLRREQSRARDDVRAEKERADRGVAAAEDRIAAAERAAAEALARLEPSAREVEVLRARIEQREGALRIAQASVEVAERRAHEAEEARATADQRAADLEQELDFLRNEALAGRAETKGRSLLRRRPSTPPAADRRPGGLVETVGRATPSSPPAQAVPPPAAAPAATADEVEQALHRRLFGS